MDVESSGKQVAPATAPLDGSPTTHLLPPCTTGSMQRPIESRRTNMYDCDSYEKLATQVLWEYCLHTLGRMPADVLADMSAGQLNQFLETLYADVRKQDGNPYSKQTLVMIRCGLQIQFSRTHQQDIIKDTAFESSNMAFHAVLGNLNAGQSIKYSDIIPDFDLAIIRGSMVTDCSNAVGLQNTIFLNLMLHFHLSKYGFWSLHNLKRTDFCIRTDAALGRRYVCVEQSIPMLLPENEYAVFSEQDIHNRDVRMYESLDDPAACLVATFEKYLAKLDHSCSSFFQRPRRNRQGEEGWYEGLVMRQSTLGYKMRDISAEAGCSLIYSNQCLKVTSKICRKRMSTGAPCTCTGQHFFPEEDRPEVGISASAPNCDMPDEEKRDSVPSEVDVKFDVKDWIKAEPVTGVEFPSDIADNHLPVKDLEVLDQQDSLSSQSDILASLPDVDFYRSLSSPCRSESPPDRIHSPPSEPSSPIAIGQNETHPEESRPVKRKSSSGVHFRPHVWKMKMFLLEGINQRPSQNGIRPVSLVRADPEESCPVKREVDDCSGAHFSPDRWKVEGGEVLAEGNQERRWLLQQEGNDPSRTVGDAEALQLQKDIRRMREENMRVNWRSRKMELQIAKLEAKVPGKDGGR